MKDKMQKLEQEIASMEHALAEKRAALEEAKQQWPIRGSKYYVPTAPYHMAVEHEDDETDHSWFEAGLACRAAEEARALHDALAVVQELRKQPGRMAFSVGDTAWGIAIVERRDASARVDCSAHICARTGAWQGIWFSSEEACRGAIKAVGEERILAAEMFLSNRGIAA
jgi:hypothetical protein